MGKLLGPCLGVLFAFVPIAASATDGVIEINQVCATQTGCFGGDGIGFPVQIASSAEGRSFRLTSDLIVPVSTRGIQIDVASVSLDLNGFRIVRSGCETASSQCNTETEVGSDGVVVSAARNTSVRNGSIVGMAGSGIRLEDSGGSAEGCIVSNMTIKWSGSSGITTREDCTIVGNRVAENGFGLAEGINAANGSTISGNVVSGSPGHGIFVAAGGGAIVSGNSVYDNGVDGIRVATGDSVITGNVSNNNGDSGIRVVAAGSTVSGNTTNGNVNHGISVTQGTSVIDNTAFGNGQIGIRGFGGTMVQRNTVRSNTGAGLAFSSSASYRANVISGNTGGTVTGGIDMGANACDGAASCP